MVSVAISLEEWHLFNSWKQEARVEYKSYFMHSSVITVVEFHRVTVKIQEIFLSQ